MQFADRYGFDGLCRAVEESGIRGCLGKIVMDIAKYAQDDAWAMHPGLVEDRQTSLLGTVKMWEKWNGAANDRIRVWFGARTPGGYLFTAGRCLQSLTECQCLRCIVQGDDKHFQGKGHPHHHALCRGQGRSRFLRISGPYADVILRLRWFAR